MTKDEVQHHLAQKRADATYPSLPKYLVKQRQAHKSLKKNKGYVESCLRGFYKRLANWKAHQPTEMTV